MTRALGPFSRRTARSTGMAALLVLLSGCETPLSTPARPSDGGAGAGASAAPTARSPAATPSAAPGGQPSGSGSSASGLAAGQAGAGSRKQITLATFEGDLLCTRLVAPFDMNDNVAELTSLVTDSTARAVTIWFDNVVANRQANRATGRSAATSRHTIPYDVRATALRMNWLPMSAEVMYGQMQLDKMRDDLLERDSTAGRKLYPEGDALLAEVLRSVTEPHGYNFQLHIRTTSGDNAIALPGGFVLVDAELIRNPALRQKAYFAIGHEIGHVLQRHETRAAQARIIDTVSLGGNVYDLVKAIRSTRGDPTPLFAVVLAGKLQFERHFGDQEMHADGCSVRMLDRTLNNNARLVSVVQSFVAELNKAPVSAGSDGAGSNAGKPSKAPLATTLQDKQEQVQVLVDVVSRPIDRHPGPRQRAANLKHTLDDLRKQPASAKPAVAPKEKAQTLTLPATPTTPKKTR